MMLKMCYFYLPVPLVRLWNSTKSRAHRNPNMILGKVLKMKVRGRQLHHLRMKHSLTQGKGQTKDNISTDTAVGDLEYDPVSRVVTRHMGIDFSPEGKAALNRRGIAIVVHGAPLLLNYPCKTKTAVTLAKHYGAACLSVDDVVQEAVASGSSSAALRARELCAKAAVVHAQKEVDEAEADMVTTVGQGASVLSVKALVKHTAEGSLTSDPKVPQSSASTRNKTNITGHSQKNNSSGPAASMTDGQVHRRLWESVSQNEELGLISCLLPTDVGRDPVRETAA